MSTVGTSLDPAKNPTPQAVQQAAPWIEAMGRYGYVAKGIVYGLMGVLALQHAMGASGSPEDQRGAIEAMGRQPLGIPLLIAVGAGLAAYAMWRLLQAVFDPECDKVLVRVGNVATALIYGALGALALWAAFGGKADDDRPVGATFAGGMIMHPIGRWVVLAAGLLLLAVAIAQFANAAKKKFERTLKEQEMNEAEERIAAIAGRAGYASRGVVFLVVGGYLTSAAWRARPEEAKGVEESLKVLSWGPYGQWLLGLVALGLIAYAVFAFVQARYRRMTPA
jgi:hypothetical protein